jgi:hypothetical protein
MKTPTPLGGEIRAAFGFTLLPDADAKRRQNEATA